MHDSPRYGYLVTKNGSPIPPANVAHVLGLGLEQYESLLAELDCVHVPSRTAAGVIFSRRMVRDDRRRAQYRKSKSKNKKEVIPHDFHTDSTRSSSSSSFSTERLKPKPAASPPLDIPIWMPEDAWHAYVEMRREKKIKITPKAALMIFNKLRLWMDLGQDPKEVLEQSVMNGWTGIFELKGGGKRNGRGPLDCDEAIEKSLRNFGFTGDRKSY